MKNYLRIILFSLLILPMSKPYAFDREKVDLLVEVMTVGCSIGMNVAIDVNSEGEISILKMGKEGKLEAPASEIPTIVGFLADENLNNEQTDKMRACIERYLSKIFAEVVGEEGFPLRVDSPSVIESGVIYKLKGCYKQGRNTIQCELTVVSSLVDRELRYYLWNSNSDHTALYDDSGSRYTPSSISVANHVNTSHHYIDNVPLIADTSMKLVILFENIASNAKSISLLSIGADQYKPQKSYNVRFRDLKIEKKSNDDYELHRQTSRDCNI